MIVEVIQYMRPNGRRCARRVEIPDEYQVQYDLILACGCELTRENLCTGKVVQYISNDTGDFDIRTTADEPEAVISALLEMLKAFDKDKLEEPFAEEEKVGLTDEEAEAATAELPIEVLQQIGPTGEFPDGKMYPEDQGELTLAIGLDEEKKLVVMLFGTSLTHLGMQPEQAIAIADNLINQAHELMGGDNET